MIRELFFCFLALFTALLLAAPKVVAANGCLIPQDAYLYTVLLDTDQDPATGVTFAGSDAGGAYDLAGIDRIILAGARQDGDKVVRINTLQVSEPLSEDNATLLLCESPDIPVGDGQGRDGSQLLEFSVSADILGNPAGPVRGWFMANQPLIARNPHDTDVAGPFLYPQPSALDVPAVSTWGMVILALLVATAATIFLRRRGGSAATWLLIVFLFLGPGILSAAAVFVLDGQPDDWQAAGAEPVLTDAVGDSSIGDDAEDILYGFVAIDEDGNYVFRLDIAGKVPLIIT
jgi:hypothetical protein